MIIISLFGDRCSFRDWSQAFLCNCYCVFICLLVYLPVSLSILIFCLWVFVWLFVLVCLFVDGWSGVCLMDCLFVIGWLFYCLSFFVCWPLSTQTLVPLSCLYDCYCAFVRLYICLSLFVDRCPLRHWSFCLQLIIHQDQSFLPFL